MGFLNKQIGKAVMSEFAKSKNIGVVLVDNIPAQITDSQLSHFFSALDDISSIQVIEAAGAESRSCWIHVSRPGETIKKINISTIDGEKPRARLMGYLFAD
jgi:hypothetical protein